MDLDIKFHNSLIFFVFRISQRVQSYLAKIFFFICIKPAFLAAKIINADEKLPDEERRSQSKSFVVIDCLIWYHRWLWKYLQLGFKINSIMSGVRHRYNLFEHLLIWNPGIPILGYQEDKTTFTIELLYEQTERGRSCDFTWLTTHNICGQFKIVSKEFDSKNDEIILKAVWLTGEERGKSFNISKNFPFKAGLKDGHYDKPSSIYYPPKWAVFGMEFFISASAILAFLQLTKDGWKTLHSLWDVIVNFF